MARKYQPLWDRLKDSSKGHRCTVQVHKFLISRVIKAVIKEKNMDLAFKMANEKNPARLVKRIIALADNKHVRIEFELKCTHGLADIKSELELEDVA
jgi:hypothetical protein